MGSDGLLANRERKKRERNGGERGGREGEKRKSGGGLLGEKGGGGREIGENGPSASLRVEQSSTFGLEMGILGGAIGHLVFENRGKKTA